MRLKHLVRFATEWINVMKVYILLPLAVEVAVIPNVRVAGELKHCIIHIAPIENIVDIATKELPVKKSMTGLNLTGKKDLW